MNIIERNALQHLKEWKNSEDHKLRLHNNVAYQHHLRE